jgi:hypothetical protein
MFGMISIALLSAVLGLGCLDDAPASEEEYAFLQQMEFSHRDSGSTEPLILERSEDGELCAAGVRSDSGGYVWVLLNPRRAKGIVSVPKSGGISLSDEELQRASSFCEVDPSVAEALRAGDRA